MYVVDVDMRVSKGCIWGQCLERRRVVEKQSFDIVG